MILEAARPDGEAFARNLIGFGRVLRRAGIPVVPQQTAELATALDLVGLEDRAAVRNAARAILVKRREDREIFDFLFDAFWADPERVVSVPPRRRSIPRVVPVEGRLTIAGWAAKRARTELPEVDVGDRAGTWSDAESLGTKAFSAMSPDELEAVRRLMAELRFRVPVRVTRRRVPDRKGEAVDLRRVLRETAKRGALPASLPRRRRAEKRRPLVLLADISGSMERYSRLALQFLHTVLRSLPHTEAFVFGTRLTRITVQLRTRNIDRAIDEAARAVVDWAGGTRIGAVLGEFNRRWSRRVLRRGAVLVIVSDGCDRGDPDRLAREMRHLQLRCHRVIWLNPHLGHDAYEPRAAGMAAALPYVDDFLSVRDLRSLEAFARVLATLPRVRGARGARQTVTT